ncbi:MAG: zinc transporter ZntB [Alphaproteobacteria bacterium]
MGLEDPAIVHAWACPLEDKPFPLENFAAIKQARAAGHLVWVHLNRAQAKSRDYLTELLKDHDPLLVDALTAEDTRPRVEPVGKGALVMLRGANLNPGAEAHDLVNLRIWAEDRMIISVRTRRLRLVKEVVQRLQKGKMVDDGASLLGMLIDRLLRNLEPIIHGLDADVDAMETRVMEKPDSALRKDIVAIRTKSIELRRFIAPQKDMMGRLRVVGEHFIGADDRFLYQELHDMSVRLVEELDSVRERAAVLQDELTNALADKLNKRLYLLSVVAAIFLPLGFLTGLLGINVGGIPMTESPYGFWLVSGAMTTLVLGQVVLFRYLRWF